MRGFWEWLVASGWWSVRFSLHCDMSAPVFGIGLFTILLIGCSQAEKLDISNFAAPDSLGKALLVSRHEYHPLGEVSFISFGNEPGNIRLVTYFSDGSTISEQLAYNNTGELQALDGQPRFVVKGERVERLAGYANASGCMNVNLTRSEEQSEKEKR